MDGTNLDYGVEFLNEEDVFVSDVEFVRMQRLKATSDQVNLGPLDPSKSLDPEVLLRVQGTISDKVLEKDLQGLKANEALHASLHGGSTLLKINYVGSKGEEAIETSPSCRKLKVSTTGKCWKVRKEGRQMVVGDDIGIGNIAQMAGKTVVGCFCEKVASPSPIKKWLEDNWNLVLGYTPIFHTLVRGWISFEFNTHEDMMEIFNRSWGWGPSGLVLKEWSISFDPARDVLSPSKIQAILPNLPLIFWREEILKDIGNSIGVFVGLEPSWDTKVDR